MRPISYLDYLVIIFGTINLLRIGLLLIGSDFYTLKKHRKQKQRKTAKENLPLVSVIIPAHNEEKTILRSVASVEKSNYPLGNLEIVVIDDGSTDKTYDLVHSYKKTHNSIAITTVTQPNSGKAHALNNGIHTYARGELIMCLDADSILTPDAIKNAVKYFDDPTVKAVSSNVKIIPDGSVFNFIQRFEYLICYQMKRAHTFFNMEYIIGGIGSMFRRETLQEIGYYDTNTVTEDIDITMKILQLGNKTNKVIYGSDVKTYTESCLTLSSLLRQRFRWKWGRYQTFYKNRNLFFSRDRKYTKSLTWFYLPFALYGDIAFLLEPIVISYILYVVIAYNDIATLISAIVVMSIYFSLNILSEDTLSRSERVKLIFAAPLMYFFFYVLSLTEYIALLRSVIKLPFIHKTIDENICTWKHVERSGQSFAS